MFRKLASELVQTVSFNMQLAKLQLDGYGRRRFRAGFDSGYSIGRDHGSRGLTKSSKPGLAGHPQSEIDGIEVDHLMAPLLRALWDLGLETQFSCQGDADHYTAHEPLLNFNRSQIVFADYDQACKFVRKTMELMDSAAYSEGGIDITTMDPMDGAAFRAAVWFPPQLLEPITRQWVEFERTVPLADGQLPRG
ncbi:MULTISPECIES: hypothetical protein [unclassified Paenarthrobacter]|uniref:hypothetical protein n=1 Tax=unclassified Paenarthrobacter TaxID=2634190 RepID=UPI00084E4A87|nr:hypothetical protein [Paenarthrobacter sp. R1]NKR10646.1 hypothetical protein [Arthrobacter sp. M5]NKR16487.1 hypothetical protein [Arthrobacter sp. M6]OEH61406.1 hypothetical protein A5N13_16805 [Arthrobacter sp. D4]OEH64392.1 hypothetical protein A5N17_06200 [Arthrobacter sp. D2]WIV29172.1 hypothetical protein QN084_12365 [Paenarthrobacter sp. R1]